MILVWSIVLVFASTGVIELIVYSSSFVVIGFILSSLLSIELTRLSVLLNSVTIKVCSSIEVVVADVAYSGNIVSLLRMIDNSKA